jgi:hypothetical protein
MNLKKIYALPLFMFLNYFFFMYFYDKLKQNNIMILYHIIKNLYFVNHLYF